MYHVKSTLRIKKTKLILFTVNILASVFLCHLEEAGSILQQVSNFWLVKGFPICLW